VQPIKEPNPLHREIKRVADDARRRMEHQLHDLADLERDLDRLDHQLSALRAQLGSRGGRKSDSRRSQEA
jgi:hypothetical protein